MEKYYLTAYYHFFHNVDRFSLISNLHQAIAGIPSHNRTLNSCQLFPPHASLFHLAGQGSSEKKILSVGTCM